MELVKKGGVRAQDKKEEPTKAPAGERKIWVCDLHPESVSDKPGQCFKDT